MKQNTILKKFLSIMLCLMIVISGIYIPSTQHAYAGDCSGKYSSPEKEIKTTVHGFTSKGNSSQFTITSMTTSSYKDAVGSIGICSTVGKPSGGKSGGKVKAGLEIGRAVANGTSTVAANQKYVYVMYYALHKGYLKKYDTTFVKVNRTIDYIRRGKYEHAQKGDYNRGFTETDYKNLISNAKTYYNNQTGGPKDHFYCWKWTNSDSDKQNFITCKQVPVEYNLSLTKSASEYEDILTNDYTCEGIEYDVYKSDKTTKVGTLVCDETGATNTITKDLSGATLTAGTYYAKETKTNSYFKLNEEWVGPITLTSSNNSGIFEAFDEPIFAPFRLQKKLDEEGNTEKSLEGFKFTLTYLMSEVEGGESSDEPVIEEILNNIEPEKKIVLNEASSDASSNASADASADAPADISSEPEEEEEEDSEDYEGGDENTYLIFEGTTDNNGQILEWNLISPQVQVVKYSGIKFNRLPIGKYKLTEDVTTPQFKDDMCETVTVNPQIINITPNDTSADATFTWVNKYPVELQMQIEKRCNDGGEVLGWEFKVTGISPSASFPGGKNFKTDRYKDPTTKTVGQTTIIETGSDGEPLKQGTYIVEEVMTDAQKARYREPAKQTITLKNGATENAVFEFTNVAWRKNLKMKKYSSDGKVEGIAFKLTGVTPWGESITRIERSDVDGYIYFQELPVGTYDIEEQNFDEIRYVKEASVTKIEGIEITKDSPEIIDLSKDKDSIFRNISAGVITIDDINHFFDKIIDLVATGDPNTIAYLCILFIVTVSIIISIIVSSRKNKKHKR